MSREIQNELSATREALRASVAELPQETAQQAASMRRIVADQIKALEELSEIVTRSGRSFDVSAPLATAAERAAPPQRRLRDASSSLAQPSRNASSVPAAIEPRAVPVRRRLLLAALAHRRRERGGWLSDLLARASTEEPAPAREPAKEAEAKTPLAPQPLDAISLDVARNDRSKRRRRGLGALSPRRA